MIWLFFFDLALLIKVVSSNSRSIFSMYSFDHYFIDYFISTIEVMIVNTIKGFLGTTDIKEDIISLVFFQERKQ